MRREMLDSWLNSLREQGVTGELLLVKETRWMKRYQIDPDHGFLASKFFFDDLEVDLHSIQELWPQMDSAERVEFVQAFIQKPSFSEEDERITNFLMESGDEPIWATLAHVLPKHSDREQVLLFLTERLVHTHKLPLLGYFEALRRLGDVRAVPTIKKKYEEFQEAIRCGQTQHSLFYHDYLHCCAALLRLEGLSEYREVIVSLSKSNDETLRNAANRLLQTK